MTVIPTNPAQVETLISTLRIGTRPGHEQTRLFSTAFDWKESYDVPGVRQLIKVTSRDEAFQYWFQLGYGSKIVTNSHLQALRLIRDYKHVAPVLGPPITLEIT